MVHIQGGRVIQPGKMLQESKAPVGSVSQTRATLQYLPRLIQTQSHGQMSQAAYRAS